MPHNSHLKVRAREEKSLMFYVDNTGENGDLLSKFSRIRQTLDTRTGYMIELAIYPEEYHHLKRLPMKVTHIKTLFGYEDSKDRKKGGPQKHSKKIMIKDKKNKQGKRKRNEKCDCRG